MNTCAHRLVHHPTQYVCLQCMNRAPRAEIGMHLKSAHGNDTEHICQCCRTYWRDSESLMDHSHTKLTTGNSGSRRPLAVMADVMEIASLKSPKSSHASRDALCNKRDKPTTSPDSGISSAATSCAPSKASSPAPAAPAFVDNYDTMYSVWLAINQIVKCGQVTNEQLLMPRTWEIIAKTAVHYVNVKRAEKTQGKKATAGVPAKRPKLE